jgi:hypothetical protein
MQRRQPHDPGTVSTKRNEFLNLGKREGAALALGKMIMRRKRSAVSPTTQAHCEHKTQRVFQPWQKGKCSFGIRKDDHA